MLGKGEADWTGAMHVAPRSISLSSTNAQLNVCRLRSGAEKKMNFIRAMNERKRLNEKCYFYCIQMKANCTL